MVIKNQSYKLHKLFLLDIYIVKMDNIYCRNIIKILQRVVQ